MTGGSKLAWLVVLLVATALGGAGLRWVMDERARTAPAAPRAHVQSTWESFRLAPGHAFHVGRMKLDCAACHRTSDGGVDRPEPERCASCHAQQATLQHAVAWESDGGDATSLSRCTACHGFGPDPTQRPEDCLRCHAEAQGHLPPVTVHAQDGCMTCHEPHQDRVESRKCRECHAVQVKHGKTQGNGKVVCTTCHDPHASATVASERCQRCHGPTGFFAVAASANHGGRGCAACHVDHNFTRRTVASCASCHKEQRVLPGAGHRACTNCHDAHALSRPVEGRCVSCHERVEPTHGGGGDVHAGPRECVQCHVPHPQPKGPSRISCTQCHTFATNESSAHGGGVDCTRCHSPHAFERGAAGACKDCHRDRTRALAQHSGHARCESCHAALPHVAGQPPLGCGSCHRAQQAAARQGHATCRSCHDAHAQKLDPVSCGGCHRREAATAVVGHARCLSCHEPHSGERFARANDCSQCHDARRLPALHQVSAHQTCAGCHSVHGGRPPAERATCLRCHEAQVDHQPEAKVCSGCHTFRGPGVRRSP